MKIFLEDVYKTSGIPTHTFVKPAEYTKLQVSIRTRGRGLVIEGPSGIGKTTSVNKALSELNLQDKVMMLSARKPGDQEFIEHLPDLRGLEIVIIDDFHVLSNQTKRVLSDYIKVLADEDSDTKLILIGINKAGDSLVSFASDLNNRIDTIKFEANPDERIHEMLHLGEVALNMNLNIKDEIVNESRGSFHIAQMLAKETCMCCDIIDNESGKPQTSTSIETVKAKVHEELGRLFYTKAKIFASGSKIRREGRAPYLHLLNWIAKSSDWSIDINDMLVNHPEMKLSIKQVMDKGFLSDLIKRNETLQDVIHFDDQSSILTIEDPKFLFFLRNVLWNKFAKQIGYWGIEFKKSYDIALSFAGENRDFAELLFHKLSSREIPVFYDHNEQHRILGENVEEYLAPIYNSEAEFVVVLMSKEYPKKLWTKFESTQFKQRFGEKSVIPIFYSDIDFNQFDESRQYGGITLDVSGDLESQADKIVNLIAGKIVDRRESQQGVSDDQ